MSQIQQLQNNSPRVFPTLDIYECTAEMIYSVSHEHYQREQKEIDTAFLTPHFSATGIDGYEVEDAIS